MSLDEMNPEQVQNLLKYIDATQSEMVKGSIFGELGRGCFFSHRMDQWIESYHGDVQAFLDRINVEQASKYWERLEFSEDRKTLVLTGRIVQNCACAFAKCPQPPLSLCHYCCKGFQETVFGALLGQKVEVEITEAFMMGGERCSTRIHLKEDITAKERRARS